MSFSLEIKDEILSLNNSKNCCLKAELSSIINYLSIIVYSLEYKSFNLSLKSENIKILNRLNYLTENLFNLSFEINKAPKFYSIEINNQIFLNNLFLSYNIQNINLHSIYQNIYINPDSFSSPCCKRAYLRMAFVCCGYICNPEKNYHIEFIGIDYSQALELKEIMSYFNIDAKIIERKGYFITYVKEGEQIVDLLNIISAHKALLKLENIRILKDVRNNINRKVNCETANLNKTINAAINQQQDIELIKNTIGLKSLPKKLKEIAEIRLSFPELSLKEIAEKLNPPISKSGVNHRFNKINIIANKLRSSQNVK